MSYYLSTPLFGISIDPSAVDPQEPFRRAQIADENGIDLITLMDHPYNRRLFDTWTLLTALGVQTQRVHVGTNVLSLPLRPPAMLAKMAATLDVLTGGRLQMGLGAGGVWDGIAAFGGPRMLRLVGRLADGIFVSHNYVPPSQLAEINERIDKGAEQAGRDPSEIRRGYNLMGVLDLGREDTKASGLDDNYIKGSVEEWVDKLVGWYRDYRQDTFIFWPVAGNQRLQIEAFAQEVAPAVRERLVISG